MYSKRARTSNQRIYPITKSCLQRERDIIVGRILFIIRLYKKQKKTVHLVQSLISFVFNFCALTCDILSCFLRWLLLPFVHLVLLVLQDTTLSQVFISIGARGGLKFEA